MDKCNNSPSASMSDIEIVGSSGSDIEIISDSSGSENDNNDNKCLVSDDDGCSFISDISSSSDSSSSDYSVEIILNKRFTNEGDTQYWVKWKNYGMEDNTWQNVEDIRCRTLIDDFEDSLKTEKSSDCNVVRIEDADSAGDNPGPSNSTLSTLISSDREVNEMVSSNSNDFELNERMLRVNSEGDGDDGDDEDDDAVGEKTGFEKGWTPSEILGVTNSSGELMYVLKWEDIDEADLFPSKIMQEKCPHLVIDYFERRITWASS